uniref:Uncharacterized protein n=1 Tax=Timema poppense TaxID=170557 RepID=A0A7R9DMS8_TIMPO|nr:unnamed protein product [Timema poppensis]
MVIPDRTPHSCFSKRQMLAWAPGKGVKGKEWKDYWEVELGVSYIPWDKMSQEPDLLDILEEGGMIDEETVPGYLRSVEQLNTTNALANYATEASLEHFIAVNLLLLIISAGSIISFADHANADSLLLIGLIIVADLLFYGKYKLA